MPEAWSRFPGCQGHRGRRADDLVLCRRPIDDAPLSLDLQVDEFLGYLRDYRRSAQATIECYARDLRRFLTFLAAEHPEARVPADVTRHMVVDFAFNLGELHMAPRTICRKIACVSSFFSFLLDMGQSQHNPAHRIPSPEISHSPPSTLSEAEAQRLVRAADTLPEQCLLLVLLGTGIRRNEAVNIRLADLDLTNGQLLVRGKGCRERIMPLRPDILNLLREYLRWRGNGPPIHLFLNRRGKAVSNRVVALVVHRAARRAGLEGVAPHKLRHTFAAWVVQSGTDICTVHELLGQSRVEMARTSDMPTKTHAVASLPALLA